MIDPISALGAASSIIAFVDFGSKITKSCYGAYTSTAGASAEHIRLEQAVEDLQAFSERLEAYREPDYMREYADEVLELKKLAGRCHGLATKLLGTLRDLQVTETGAMRYWDAFIDSGHRLEQRSANFYTSEIIRSNYAMQQENIARWKSSNDSLMASMARQEQDIRRLADVVRSCHVPQVAANPKLDASIRQYSSVLAAASESAKTLERNLKILASLTFPEMQMRHSEIRDAYRGTYSWVYDESASNFRQWLKSDAGIFWISGKAGSGKSGLVKFICDNPKTKKTLQYWAGKDHALVMASWYFWNSGYPMQKTQLGLLQSLLFQMLKQCADLIPEAVPKRWLADEFAQHHPERWTRNELSEAFAVVLKHRKLAARFCFFIDGLDEYEGDHYTLIQDLQEMVNTGVVKLCVSSRPWNAFTSAYGHLKGQQLILQDLTRADMQNYVKGMLENNARFKRLSDVDPSAHDLIAEIQERAQGVFLWVFLVVRSLLRGLTEDDDIAMLQKRLRQLPSDLRQFFQHMLDSVDDVYQEYTARTLLIVLEASQPLSMLAFWYLDTDLEKPDYLLELDRVGKVYGGEAWCGPGQTFRGLAAAHRLELYLQHTQVKIAIVSNALEVPPVVTGRLSPASLRSTLSQGTMETAKSTSSWSRSRDSGMIDQKGSLSTLAGPYSNEQRCINSAQHSDTDLVSHTKSSRRKAFFKRLSKTAKKG